MILVGTLHVVKNVVPVFKWKKYWVQCGMCRLSVDGKYYIPRDGSLQSYKDYISTLPAVDQPQVFGQHPNADISSLITETRQLCATLMSLQMQGGSTGQETNTEDTVSVTQDIYSFMLNSCLSFIYSFINIRLQLTTSRLLQYLYKVDLH